MSTCIIDSSDGGLYRDEDHAQALPHYIGPFASPTDAQAYLASLSPLWGSYTIPLLTAPQG